MNQHQKLLLSRLPPLGVETAKTPPCKICAAETMFFDVVDFYKHCSHIPYRFGVSGISVLYYRCGRCNFIFTDLIDDWSQDEIAKFIYNDDYIKVDPEYLGDRALRTARDMAARLRGCEELRILDYGSGSGTFAREMAKNGFKYVESFDPYSSPVEPVGLFDLITCFEVIEHSPEPLRIFGKMAGMLAEHGAIIVGQSLQPGNIEELGAHWWYVGPRNGHVSIFAEETFVLLAAKLDLVYHRGGGVYVFARRPTSPAVQKAIDGIGLPVYGRRLLAPPEGDAGAAWNPVEQVESRSFRWTAADEVSWGTLALHPGVTVIEIPFLMQIRDGFALECTVLVDGNRIPARVAGRRILAEVTVHDSITCTVNLRTPPPLRPSELTGSADSRRLGLAVACSFGGSPESP